MPASLGTFSGGGLGFGVAFTLRDKFTKTSKKIEQSLDRLGSRVALTQKKVNRSLAGIRSGALAIGIGAALILPLISGINKLTELEDKLADVRKTTGFTDRQVRGLQGTLQDLDTRTSLNELLDISRIGGQIGVAKNEVAAFTESIDKAVVALGDEFTGGAEQVASEIGKINSIFKVDKAFGVANVLWNN